MEYYTLKNGLRVIHQQVSHTGIGHLGLFVNVGSRDEEKGEEGIAHFLEHVLFKGTKKRKPFHILNRLDSVGGELNAYTTKEETCIHASFLNEYLSRTVELISDIVLNSTFPEHELEKEIEVVLDEIQSYKDSPSDMIFEEFDSLIYPDHPLGYDILGTEEQVKSITRDKVLKFVKKHYYPSNMIVSSVGNYPLNKLVKLLERFFDAEVGEIQNHNRLAFKNSKPIIKELTKDVNQTHVVMGCEAYPMSSEKRIPLILLTNILGGPAMNSRLNLEVRERHGVAYNVESNYVPFSDTGIFSIYFGTDRKNVKKALRLVNKELRKLMEKPLGIRQFQQAKQQLKGHLALGMESKSGLMQSMGKSYLYFDKVDTIEESLLKIEEITPADLHEIANELFKEENLSCLIYKSKE